MTLAAKFALLAVSACAMSFFCASSCASTEAKKRQQMQELTPEQIANMTPDEVADYYARRAELRSQQRYELEEETAGNSIYSNLHSVEKRERLGNVNERLKDDASNAVFPWQSHDPRRSESLLGRESAVYQW
jgi:hypothetical protein